MRQEGESELADDLE